MKDQQVRTPDDLAGLKVRVSGAVPGRVVEALGATPVQMPATEMHNALQTGLIDGIMTGASAIGDLRLNEVADVYVESPSLGHILFYVVVDEPRYQGLPDDQRAALDDASGTRLSRSGEGAGTPSPRRRCRRCATSPRRPSSASARTRSPHSTS